jgi:hypothetical protein
MTSALCGPGPLDRRTRAIGQHALEIFRDGNADGTYTEVAEGFGDVVDPPY